MGVPAASTTSVVTAAQKQNPYVEYSLVTDYLYVSGTLAIPVAFTLNSPPSSSTRQAQEIVQLSQPYSQRVVTFTVARVNAAPVAPAIDILPNERLKSARVSTQAPIIGSDALTRTYRITGQYIYDHITPVYPGSDTLDMGTNVADTQGPSIFTVESGQFQPLASRIAGSPQQANLVKTS